MFSNPTFIAATRQFVCVRLETYESAENEKIIRKLLDGRFANTAFCLLAPDGETELSRPGRSPSSLFGRRGGGFAGSEEEEVTATIAKLRLVAKKYEVKAESSKAVLQDFSTFRQALNVASGDQRLLLLTVSDSNGESKLTPVLKKVLNDPGVVGRFHHDFANLKTDSEWSEAVTDVSEKTGYFIIRPGSFGLDGEVMAQLPLTTNAETLKKVLLKENLVYAKDEKRKVYGDHVKEGRRDSVYFENEIPYGEDRDGDGLPDSKRNRRR